MATETKLTARLVKSWVQMGYEVISIHGNQFQAPGWPDVFVCGTLYTGFIEFKGRTTPTQPNQTRILTALEKSPVPACVVRFLCVKGELWSMQAECAAGATLRCFALAGPDGRIAASLLRELGGLL